MWLLNMKGIELPINILIIVAVAVIVLIALIAMFYPAFLSGSQTVSIETAKTQACRSWIANSCSISWDSIGVINFDADKNGKVWGTTTEAINPPEQDNIHNLCSNYLQTTVEADCKKLCGC